MIITTESSTKPAQGSLRFHRLRHVFYSSSNLRPGEINFPYQLHQFEHGCHVSLIFVETQLTAHYRKDGGCLESMCAGNIEQTCTDTGEDNCKHSKYPLPGSVYHTCHTNTRQSIKVVKKMSPDCSFLKQMHQSPSVIRCLDICVSADMCIGFKQNAMCCSLHIYNHSMS